MQPKRKRGRRDGGSGASHPSSSWRYTDRGSGIEGSGCGQKVQSKASPKPQPQPPPEPTPNLDTPDDTPTPVGGDSTPPLPGSGYPNSAPIKGNMSSMIYYPPGDQFYGKTKAERCFSSTSDAEEEGYRASKR